MAWRLWVRGLVAAVISGVSNSVVLMAIDPLDFNLETGLVKLGKVAAASGIVGLFLYLKQHPDPWKDY